MLLLELIASTTSFCSSFSLSLTFKYFFLTSSFIKSLFNFFFFLHGPSNLLSTLLISFTFIGLISSAILLLTVKSRSLIFTYNNDKKKYISTAHYASSIILKL